MDGAFGGRAGSFGGGAGCPNGWSTSDPSPNVTFPCMLSAWSTSDTADIKTRKTTFEGLRNHLARVCNVPGAFPGPYTGSTFLCLRQRGGFLGFFDSQHPGVSLAFLGRGSGRSRHPKESTGNPPTQATQGIGQHVTESCNAPSQMNGALQIPLQM